MEPATDLGREGAFDFNGSERAAGVLDDEVGPGAWIIARKSGKCR